MDHPEKYQQESLFRINGSSEKLFKGKTVNYLAQPGRFWKELQNISDILLFMEGCLQTSAH